MNTVSPKFVRASSKGTNVQTGKDRYFTTERLVKIALIGRVSSNKYGVGAILWWIASGVLRPFVVWNKKQNARVMDLRWKKRGQIMLSETP